MFPRVFDFTAGKRNKLWSKIFISCFKDSFSKYCS